MSVFDDFFEKLEEPNKSTFLYLKEFIKNYHPDIQLYFKWKLPYLYYKEKPLCYIWKNKKTNEPYLGFAKGVQMIHPSLIKGDRTTIKILPIPTNKDINIELIAEVLEEALKLY